MAGINQKTYEELFGEVESLREKLARLEASEAERQQVEAELRARVYQQAVVAQLGQRVLSGISLVTLFEETTHFVAQTLKVDYCQIMELLPDRDILLLRAGVGWPLELIGVATVEARPDSHVGYTLFSSEPVIVKDLATDRRFSEGSLLHERRIVSGMSVIIDGEEWPFGVLSIHTAEKRVFTKDDINFLQSIANVLATAVEHKRAQRILQEARDQLEIRVKERTADLEAANEELKTFAYIVSHDLRAPLVNIRGFSSELEFSVETIKTVAEDVISQLDEQQQTEVRLAIEEDIPEALDFINSSVTRMDYLINAILRLSRLGRRELNFEPINMNALIEATLKTLAHQIDKREAKVKLHDLPVVMADRTAMEQIIGNILSNAVNYLKPDSSGEIEISGTVTHRETEFKIRDNGRGIAKSDMHKVFELFRRAGQPNVPGEGLGLAYVRTMVRRHGGRIWCESELGVGTTFTFTISNHLVQGED